VYSFTHHGRFVLQREVGPKPQTHNPFGVEASATAGSTRVWIEPFGLNVSLVHPDPPQLDSLVLQQLSQLFNYEFRFTRNRVGDGLGEWVESGTYPTCAKGAAGDQKCGGGYENVMPEHGF